MNVRRVLSRGVPWIVVTVIGVLVAAISAVPKIPDDAAFWMRVVSGAAVVGGQLGLGAVIGAERADDATRARMVAPFQRTVELYQGLARLDREVSYARFDTKERGAADMPTQVVEAHLRALAVRLQEQGAGSRNAMNEWRLLVPELVQQLEAEAEKEAE